MSHKVLVCDKIAAEGLEILRQAGEVEALTETLAEEELCAKVAPYHALVVRSATKVTGKVIEAARELRVIGRAGVGVDNIDVAAATERGIVVINSPEGNTIAAAEHALALLLSLSRNIAEASRSTKAGEWRKADFMGTEVYQKSVGVIGVGKIGSLVAQRCKALGMRVLGYDPYLSAERARQLGIEKVELDELLAEADFVAVHAAKTPETMGLIGEQELAKMKPTARLVNCARGGIVDEQALYEALKAGTIAAAALDVFAEEPPGDIPLFELPNFVATPHLGASTREAQAKVAVDVAEQIVEVLGGGQARTPVNSPAVPSELMAQLAPYLHLVEQMGKMHAHFHKQAISDVEISYSGEIAEGSVAPLTPRFLVGLLSPQLEQAVNTVNASLIAESRGVNVVERKTQETLGYASLISTRVVSGGTEMTIDGTLFGRADPRIVRVNEYRIDIVPQGLTLFTWHYDRPGVIGNVGTLLGNNKVNIAGMQVGRAYVGSHAFMALSVDNPIPEELIREIDSMEHIESSTLVDFGPAPEADSS
ncbi:MAG: phosphoglycerate dehydrogenase [Armatimonadota bacterium]